jgi:hypothetical protein
MKKIYLFTILLGSIIVGCNPMEDLHNEAKANNPGVVAEVQLTLIDDDYTNDIEDGGLGLNFTSFSSEDDAKSMLPAFLTERYPYLSDGSSAFVGYNLYIGSAEGVSDYTSADDYEVTEADYYAVATEVGDAGFFNNSYKAEDYIPGILDTNIASPEDGKRVAVSYEYDSIEYIDISGTVIYAEDFEGIADLSGMNTFSASGAQEWYLYSSSTPYKAARMSGYSGGNQPNEDWLILPEIDLTGFSNAELKLSQVINFLGSSVIGEDLKVSISTDYTTGDPTVATWIDLTLDQWPVGDSYDIVDSKVSLADYSDQIVYVAFYYKSTVDYAAQWRLVNISVEEGDATETINYNVFYEYNDADAEWSPAGDEVYYLSSADYDSMGEASGQPGRHNNFSSSIPADDYITTFLEINYPYAQEEDEIIVIYKYFTTSTDPPSTQTRGNSYTIVSGVWTPHTSIIAKYAGLIGNLANYGDFDYNWTSTQIEYALAILLDHIDPSAEEGQKYLLTYVVYDNGENVRSTSFIKTGGEWVTN